MTESWPLILAVLAVVLASFRGWCIVERRIRRGEEPLPREPRPINRWTGAETMLVVLTYLVCGMAGSMYAQHSHQREVAAERNVEAVVDQPVAEQTLGDSTPAGGAGEGGITARQLFHSLRAKVFADLAFLVLCAVLFTVFRPTPAVELGLISRPLEDLKLGLIAFFVIVPPVLLLQVTLAHFWRPSEHPVLVTLQEEVGWSLWLIAAAAVVGTAPLVEEFLFRGIFQNWLEETLAARAEPRSTAEPHPADLVEREEGAIINDSAVILRLPSGRSLKGGDIAIVVSSALFALAHLGHGPDPIPLFFLALGLGYLFRQTHRIWPGVVVHTLLNAFSLFALAADL